jgi:hypothetical protein
MIHIVTIFFPAPGAKPWVARRFLLERHLAQLKSFGHHAPVPIPFKHHLWKTRQKNYLFTELTVWFLEKHDRQARRHMLPRTKNSKKWRQPK